MQTVAVSARTPLIALIAGEDSGDQLGADLVAALRQRYPQARFVGIGGARMQAQGFASWYDMHELSLFGFSEVIRHLPRLLRLRKALLAQLLDAQPAVVVGIDAPDFNLGLEQRLKQAGLRGRWRITSLKPNSDSSCMSYQDSNPCACMQALLRSEGGVHPENPNARLLGLG